ncbi:N-acetylmuramoyl-L-alanine amidase [Niveibacterium terrae]|uniref:N-acetylmuramoyl-L-alanine amidase n=1 Tax=Niveibacterium terrae TaxID=3373598 RepID=UPI003A8ECD9B
MQPLAAQADCSVALDVGHFREKPGATSARGRTEFSFNLAQAVAIRTALRARGCTVDLIGAGGDAAVLRARTAMAPDQALFLSIHHDSVHADLLQSWRYEGRSLLYSDRFSGFALFVSHENPDLPGSLVCASAIGEALRGRGLAPSRYHADPDLGESRLFLDEANGVHAYDGLAVLRSARQRAVLLEVGVLVNRADERRLARPEGRAVVAAAVAEGVVRCLAEPAKIVPPQMPASPALR